MKTTDTSNARTRTGYVTLRDKNGITTKEPPMTRWTPPTRPSRTSRPSPEVCASESLCLAYRQRPSEDEVCGRRPAYHPCDNCGQGSRRAREDASRRREAALAAGVLDVPEVPGMREETSQEEAETKQEVRKARRGATPREAGLAGKGASPWTRDMGVVVRRRRERGEEVA